jgi:hypothetical protein
MLINFCCIQTYTEQIGMVLTPDFDIRLSFGVSVALYIGNFSVLFLSRTGIPKSHQQLY